MIKKLKQWIQWVNNKLNKLNEQTRLEFEREKNQAINFIKKELSREYIESYNKVTLVHNSGFTSGNYTERDIKLAFLSQESHLFTDEELDYYKDYILKHC